MKSGKSRQLTIVFLAVLVPAAATLVWLGLRLLEQDRILYAQRAVERQEAAADGRVGLGTIHPQPFTSVVAVRP